MMSVRASKFAIPSFLAFVVGASFIPASSTGCLSSVMGRIKCKIKRNIVSIILVATTHYTLGTKPNSD